MQFAPRVTGYLKIDVDFVGHSTYEPLSLRVESSSESSAGDAALASSIEAAIRDALTVKASVVLVPLGSIERPGAQKEKLIERVTR